MKKVKIGSLNDTHVIESSNFICLDICRERMLKRITKSEKLNGKVKNPPVEAETKNLELKTTDLYCYKAWKRIQSRCVGSDRYTEILEKCERNDTYYMPLSRKESDMAMKILRKFSIKELLNLYLLSLRKLDIKQAEKTVNIRIGEESLMRHIIENIKKSVNEEETLYVLAREDRVENIISKIEFETRHVDIERI